MVISRGWFEVSSTSGSAIFAPDSTMAALVTMKMISSTKKISVSGVMLISAMIGDRARFLRLPSAIGPPSRMDGVDDPIARDRQRRLDPLHPCLEVVVKDYGHDGHDQPQGGGDEG